MRQSGLFDRQFYLGANPSLHWLFKMFPERHYALFGEAAGLYPNPDFAPKAYLRHNHDVQSSNMAPLDHYIKRGRHEQRLTEDIPDLDTSSGIALPKLRMSQDNPARYAVVIHIYYHDLWAEFSEKLKTLDISFDLFITLTYKKHESDALAERIMQEWPDAIVIYMPNHGRDIFPFIHLLNAGMLEPYDAVCKFHTKKSPHRQDGDHWRQHLIDGILPASGSADMLERFGADPQAVFWVADGQHYNGPEWWGSNFDRTAQLLQRVEFQCDSDHLSFPAGSMYWVKPQILALLRGLQLKQDDFETEFGQTDGTTAHAIERVMGVMAEAAGLNILQTHQLAVAPSVSAPPAKPTFVSAFYLPQFHPTPENDTWWGKGFTEWTSVTRATPNFSGHMQPMLPTDLGFYDLRTTETMGQQAALAQGAGIDAFCVYHYWFGGKRILEAPIDRLLQRADIDFPFYLCWANESWRRNWDGLTGDVLLEQAYAPGFATALAESLVPYFKDPRYQRPDGTRPRFVIYRPEDMPDPAAAVAEMRETWRRLGIGEVELGAVLFHVEGENPVAETLFDFWVEMPPHGLVTGKDCLFGGLDGNQMQTDVHPEFSGLIYDYNAVRQTSLSDKYRRALPAHTISGIMPSWDNTARRGRNAHTAYGANPATFERWLRGLLAKRVPASYRNELFINAWNEWAEKAMLEPSQQYGTTYLDALRRNL
jgi:lipopolysaccharide biosynthesis protein